MFRKLYKKSYLKRMRNLELDFESVTFKDCAGKVKLSIDDNENLYKAAHPLIKKEIDNIIGNGYSTYYNNTIKRLGFVRLSEEVYYDFAITGIREVPLEILQGSA